MMDRLDQMLGTQLSMQRTHFDNNPPQLEGKALIEFIKWNVLAIEDELHEALNEVSWKPWAKDEFIHVEAFLGELVDAWHFLMNLILTVATADEFAEAYFAKVKVNKRRQEAGYTVEGKGLHDRAEDEPAHPSMTSRARRLVDVWKTEQDAEATEQTEAAE